MNVYENGDPQKIAVVRLRVRNNRNFSILRIFGPGTADALKLYRRNIESGSSFNYVSHSAKEARTSCTLQNRSQSKSVMW